MTAHWTVGSKRRQTFAFSNIKVIEIVEGFCSIRDGNKFFTIPKYNVP